MSLVIFVWIANTIRIFMLGFVGLTFGVDYAMGPFHDWGGLLAITIMFFSSGTLFHLIKERLDRRDLDPS